MTTGERIDRWLARMQFGVRARRRWYQVLERFTRRGNPHEEALRGAWQRMQRKRDPRRHMMQDLLGALNEGQAFSQAVAPFIPAAERLMVASGETTGKYADGFRQAASVASGVERMQAALRAQLTYPAVLLLAGAGALLVAAYGVLPAMVQIAPDVALWPTPSKALYYAAETVRRFGWLILLVLVAGVTLIYRTLDTWVSPRRAWVDKYIPPWTMYRAYQGAAFLLAFGSLTQTGRPVSEALEDIRSVSGSWMRSHVDRMQRVTGEGKSAGRALDTGLLDPETIGGIDDYSRAGSFDQAIVAMGEDAIEDGVTAINAAGGRARAVAFLLMMVLILLLWAGVAMLMLDIYNKSQGQGMP